MKEKGRRVLLVDLDPQGCLTFSLARIPTRLSVSIHDVLLGGGGAGRGAGGHVGGDDAAARQHRPRGAEAMLLMRAGREYALKRGLAKIGGQVRRW